MAIFGCGPLLEEIRERHKRLRENYNRLYDIDSSNPLIPLIVWNPRITYYEKKGLDWKTQKIRGGKIDENPYHYQITDELIKRYYPESRFSSKAIFSSEDRGFEGLDKYIEDLEKEVANNPK